MPPKTKKTACIDLQCSPFFISSMIRHVVDGDDIGASERVEVAVGAVQALIGLVLVFTGNQLARFFGGGYGSSSGGDSAGVIFLLVGLALIVAGVSRPLKLLR